MKEYHDGTSKNHSRFRSERVYQKPVNYELCTDKKHWRNNTEQLK